MNEMTPNNTADRTNDVAQALVEVAQAAAALEQAIERAKALMSTAGGSQTALLPLLQAVLAQRNALGVNAPAASLAPLSKQLVEAAGGPLGATTIGAMAVLAINLILQLAGIEGPPLGETATPTGQVMTVGPALSVVAGVILQWFKNSNRG